MISDNYTILFLFVIILVILGLSFLYFFKDLKKVLSAYYYGRQKKDVTTTPAGIDNPSDPTADTQMYYDDPMDDPDSVDPITHLPPEKQQYLKDLGKTYKSYNKEKATYIANNYEGKEDDDLIDARVIYPEYDNYDYSEPPKK